MAENLHFFQQAFALWQLLIRGRLLPQPQPGAGADPTPTWALLPHPSTSGGRGKTFIGADPRGAESSEPALDILHELKEKIEIGVK